VFSKKLFFPDCCTVIRGAPRLVVGAARLVVGTPRLVFGAPWLVVGAPSCSQVHPTFSPALWEVPKLITTTPMVLLYQSSEIPVTLKAGRNALLGSNTLLKLTHLSLHATLSQTLLEPSSPWNTFCSCTASEWIYQLARSPSRSASLSSLDHRLQVYLKRSSITALGCIYGFTRSSFSGAPRIALKPRLQPVHIYHV